MGDQGRIWLEDPQKKLKIISTNHFGVFFERLSQGEWLLTSKSGVSFQSSPAKRPDRVLFDVVEHTYLLHHSPDSDRHLTRYIISKSCFGPKFADSQAWSPLGVWPCCMKLIYKKRCKTSEVRLQQKKARSRGETWIVREPKLINVCALLSHTINTVEQKKVGNSKRIEISSKQNANRFPAFDQRAWNLHHES